MEFRSVCAVVAVVCALSGCGAGAPLERAGVTVRPPADWRPVAAATWPVPGVPLAAWSGPNGASLVVYRSLPIPDGRPETLTTALVNRLEDLTALKIVSRGNEAVAGTTASRVECTASGTGDAFAPTGRGEPIVNSDKPLRPTRRVVVALLRAQDTISLVWHAPESSADALAASVRETLATLKLSQGSLARQSYD